jgi:isopentenyl-diphosphate Delta-isomerase
MTARPHPSPVGRVELVELVDDEDRPVGTAEKLDAHRRGLRHRAISVIVWNGRGELLLQQRAAGKYHSGGLWTNACCGHPRPGEGAALAAGRRLAEEMGFTCPLTPLFRTHYRADVGNGLIEDEIVHGFGGRYDGLVRPVASEAQDIRWLAATALAADLETRAEAYTVWFRLYADRFWHHLSRFPTEAGLKA